MGMTSFREVLEKMLVIVVLPVRKSLRKEVELFSPHLVSNTCGLLASIVSELTASALGSEVNNIHTDADYFLGWLGSFVLTGFNLLTMRKSLNRYQFHECCSVADSESLSVEGAKEKRISIRESIKYHIIVIMHAHKQTGHL